MITAEIIEVEEEAGTGNIINWVCFKDDGKEVVWNHPSGPLIRNGHNVWPLMSGAQNFISLSKEERDLWLSRNIQSQIGNLIREKAKAKINIPVLADLKSRVGATYSMDTVDVKVSIPATSEKRIVTIKDDGTWVVKEAGIIEVNGVK